MRLYTRELVHMRQVVKLNSIYCTHAVYIHCIYLYTLLMTLSTKPSLKSLAKLLLVHVDQLQLFVHIENSYTRNVNKRQEIDTKFICIHIIYT